MTSTTPVVLLVFDELPLTSLMDERRLIDPVRYPNFARLAENAHWFRNATTVTDTTTQSVPAILTGRIPDGIRIPTFEDYPNNLFTLLSDSYELRVFESSTRLCPPRLCGDTASTPDLPDRVRSMLMDVVVMYLHIILPDEMTLRLPPINQSWHDFRGPAG